MYYAREEILLQSGALNKTWEAVYQQKERIQAFFAKGEEIVFVACGSSYWLSLSAHRTLGLTTQKRAFVAKAGDIVLNPKEYTKAYKAPVFVFPSRSGATSEQLRALAILKEAYGDVPVLSIIEYPNSELEKLSDISVWLPWANETSVCQTQSFSCLYLALIAMASFWDDNLQKGMTDYLAFRAETQVRDFSRVKQFIAEVPDIKHIVALGSGRQYGVTIEGAYICIEMAQMVCSYYGLLEYRHGPIVTTDSHTLIAICGGENSRPFEQKVLSEAKHFGAKTLSVIDQGELPGSDYLFKLNKQYPPEATALHFVFIMQSIAYFIAVSRGLDPDHPGELVPFIQL